MFKKGQSGNPGGKKKCAIELEKKIEAKAPGLVDSILRDLADPRKDFTDGERTKYRIEMLRFVLAQKKAVDVTSGGETITLGSLLIEAHQRSLPATQAPRSPQPEDIKFT